MEKSVMLKFSRLHSDSFLVYDSEDNHIGEVYRSAGDLWEVMLHNVNHGVKYVNLIDAKQAAENIFLRKYEIETYDVGC
jgi:hypothetical protein